jgi:hypothetical protein
MIFLEIANFSLIQTLAIEKALISREMHKDATRGNSCRACFSFLDWAGRNLCWLDGEFDNCDIVFWEVI